MYVLGGRPLQVDGTEVRTDFYEHSTVELRWSSIQKIRSKLVYGKC